ncbi:MAG: adenylate/guanylate cyclase domain-containing protein [Thermoguttaceae bacterium]
MGEGFQLVFQDAEGPAVRQFDQARVLLGRSIVCDVVFDSPHLSRKHSEIVRDADGWTIQDLRSRNGVAVNGQRVARQGLAHGDRIVLAPDAAEPTLLEFRLAEFADPTPPQAILSDEAGPTSVVASIDLRELSNTLSQSGRGEHSPIELHSGDVAGRLLTAPDASGGALYASTSQLPVLSMFKSAGEILLVHESLDEMLQQVVNLIAEHLPGRRGAACMVDQASGEIQPRCFSQEKPDEPRVKAHARPPRREGMPSQAQPAAQRWRPFLISRSILHEAVRVRRAMLVASVADDPRFHGAASIQEMGIRSAICVPLYHQGQVTGVIYVDSQRDAGPLGSSDLEVLTVLGLMVAAGIAQISLRSDVARERQMRQRLARYNSPQVVEQIMKLEPRQEDEMLADEYDVSVLFADITGFSALAESWSAVEVVRVLNLVFERWTANVFQRDGTLDKYIGDAVMAVFGAPLRQTDHAQGAVATALAMQETLDDLNRLRPQEPALQLRIGINSGRVIAGDIGSPLHKAYTVIGDVVNIASRLETSVALPSQILIGQATYEQVQDQYDCEPLGEVRLRGKRHAIQAYRVVGHRK